MLVPPLHCLIPLFFFFQDSPLPRSSVPFMSLSFSSKINSLFLFFFFFSLSSPSLPWICLFWWICGGGIVFVRMVGEEVGFTRKNITLRIFMRPKKLMQTVGLLSFTFLTRAGLDRVVVPMWSPFSTEEELLKQFDDIGDHGTKIIIYNLWLNDEGEMELNFQSDPEAFWHVVGGSSVNRSRGVVGVLEANFVKPTHNKQDFEKTPLFQKLENRLKEMTWEYWQGLSLWTNWLSCN